MRTLKNVAPTPEQLGILSRNTLGVEIIRGAAGSGKTTTALLRLRSLVGVFLNRRKRMSSITPVKILVLGYNRTLRGYISELASDQVDTDMSIELEVSTFSKWAKNNLPFQVSIIDDNDKDKKISNLGCRIPLEPAFLIEEVDYVMGRFTYPNLESYITIRRDGRGAMPRVDKSLRRQILDEVIYPYQKFKNTESLWDWNDFATHFSMYESDNLYDIVIVDEAQDFSANQIRAILNQRHPENSITFVLDTAQRIYARGYTWSEVGITIRPEHVHRLERNYRNTKQIAAFASAIIKGVPTDDDATLPDFSKSDRHGPVPVVLKGSFSSQVRYATSYIEKNINLKDESVVFLHPLGWFNYLKQELSKSNLAYVELTRRENWPSNTANIGLCTLHSAKGLEFDHVIILGLNAEVTRHGKDEGDSSLDTLRRLLAMGIGRAKQSVILGYKATERSKLFDYLDSTTYHQVNL